MSKVATVVGAEDDTLKRTINPDDSLCTDEFEIISSDTCGKFYSFRMRHTLLYSLLTVNEAGAHVDDTVSQWTMQHTINVESLVPLNNLASLLCSTHSDDHSVTPK